MYDRIRQVIENEEDNYLFPFFWMHAGKTEGLPERVKKVYESGCRALCIESRPHEEFCEDGWWKDLDIILKEARRYDMKVWILDDKHFPTGYANGRLQKEKTEHRRWFLREHHVDVIGAMRETAVLVPALGDEEQILAAAAYKRGDSGDRLEGKYIDLTGQIFDGFLYWDVPEGFFRIFFLIKTRKGSLKSQQYYISGLSRESVGELIHAVYEPHYQHFSEYFGNTLAGFFSDEPGFYTQHTEHWGYDQGDYNHTVGQPGLALPWEDAIISMMLEHETMYQEGEEKRDGLEKRQVLCRLPELWYAAENGSYMRLAYMDAVTKLWKRCFTMQIGDWCRAHGVKYMGHIIEDMDAHQRIGSGAGHYFRALGGQDISGVDIVLHQVMPGYADYDVASVAESGRADRRFFHYILPKLAVSLARIEPRMKGRAMCEVFGAYGWAESVTMMKWMIDFLLIRGVNRFVPHAFTDTFPDDDCPPHFYANGNNPQFPGFEQLMRYTNKACHLLEGLDLQTDGAILYPAEAEWMSSPEYVSMNDAAKILYDAHIDFDILPLEVIEHAKMRKNWFEVNGHVYRFLLIPAAKMYPDKLYRSIFKILKNNIPVYWFESGETERDKSTMGMQTVTTQTLIQEISKRFLVHCYTENSPYLRIAHFKKGKTICFMLFWEDVRRNVETMIQLPCKGKFIRCDLLNKQITKGTTSDGTVEVFLTPYQSELLFFDEFEEEWWESLPCMETWYGETMPELLWDIYLMELGNETEFRKVREKSRLFSITGKNGWPHFSGKILYETKINLAEANTWGIDLGNVGGTAKLSINGMDLGMRISPPYRWNISQAVHQGENRIVIEAANTLAHRIHDRFSEYIQIAPGGLTGPVKFWKIHRNEGENGEYYKKDGQFV
ncbi:hypothetical protein EBB54_07575 [Schaedlerella arabinosiphila]|uniref:Glycoside hydrolase n=1 Tax=Schaedlerella arabinosiphila TaxID=2044587 RepID=A0A3R8LX94_9FIRM|nr:hypothetical protein [Schaedlerella arabinosiphila]RRK31236.1 hypothetical protein EBB54_07575 [Schaedlerella arabinosiphila]